MNEKELEELKDCIESYIQSIFLMERRKNKSLKKDGKSCFSMNFLRLAGNFYKNNVSDKELEIVLIRLIKEDKLDIKIKGNKISFYPCNLSYSRA